VPRIALRFIGPRSLLGFCELSNVVVGRDFFHDCLYGQIDCFANGIVCWSCEVHPTVGEEFFGSVFGDVCVRPENRDGMATLIFN
jgi:hypothetical protein